MNDKALSAFMARKMRIDELLERIQEASYDHFGVCPDEIHWGHVGALGDISEDLESVCDALFACS